MSDSDWTCMWPQCSVTGKHGHLGADVARWRKALRDSDATIPPPIYADAPGNPTGLSTTEYCNLLPWRRYLHEAKGKLLLFPRTGLVGVPYDMTKGGSYNVVVVKGDETYPVGGYHLSIGELEIVTALEVEWDASVLKGDQIRADWKVQ